VSELSYIDCNLAQLRAELAKAVGDAPGVAGRIAAAAESGAPARGCPLVVAAVKYALPEELEQFEQYLNEHRFEIIEQAKTVNLMKNFMK